MQPLDHALLDHDHALLGVLGLPERGFEGLEILFLDRLLERIEEELLECLQGISLCGTCCLSDLLDF
jgi:hypothetical protein